MKKLDGLRWVQKWNSQMGCIEGAVDFLQGGISEGGISARRLFGGTGYAFVINISKTADESCPTAWNTQMIRELAPLVGVKLSGFYVRKADAGVKYPTRQKQAWDSVRAAIDRGLPCYGWEVQPYMPEYQVITGYDEAGYYYSGYETGGPAKWEEYGDHDVKHIEVYRVELCPGAPERELLKTLLQTVLELSADPDGWAVGAGYTTGPAAFDVWARSLENGEAKRDGTSYNALVWQECRAQAVDFLEEVCQGEIDPAASRSLKDAAASYARSRDALKELSVLVPMSMEIWDSTTPLKSTAAAQWVRKAGSAERQALMHLQAALSAL
jgi:hypothetical protein